MWDRSSISKIVDNENDMFIGVIPWNKNESSVFLHPEILIFRDCRPMNFENSFFILFTQSINAMTIGHK